MSDFKAGDHVRIKDEPTYWNDRGEVKPTHRKDLGGHTAEVIDPENADGDCFVVIRDMYAYTPIYALLNPKHLVLIESEKQTSKDVEDVVLLRTGETIRRDRVTDQKVELLIEIMADHVPFPTRSTCACGHVYDTSDINAVVRHRAQLIVNDGWVKVT